ncbi:hypothetical protein V2J09_001542 [Rumex salicifolius]
MMKIPRLSGETVWPLVAMVVVQLGYAGMNILSKVALEAGMDPFVLVAYRQIVAFFVTFPFALYLERHKIPEITKQILFQIFLCSLFGATGNILLYFVGLKYTSATIGCALNNTLPAFTFLFAIPFGLEKVGISRPGQAKIIGTAVCIGGAMLLSFYHGHVIGLGNSKISWGYADALQNKANGSSGGASGVAALLLGPFLVLGSNICWAIWFIIQAKMGQTIVAPYTTTTLMCLMSAFQCTCAALFFSHKVSAWALLPPIRLVAGLYAGAIGSGLAFCLMTWAIQKKGPLYVAVFNPFLLVVVAFLSWALLEEKLYIGTAVGSVLIVAGLYAVLWGKNKEAINDKAREEANMAMIEDNDKASVDIELQQKTSPNGYIKNKIPGRN